MNLFFDLGGAGTPELCLRKSDPWVTKPLKTRNTPLSWRLIEQRGPPGLQRRGTEHRDVLLRILSPEARRATLLRQGICDTTPTSGLLLSSRSPRCR